MVEFGDNTNVPLIPRFYAGRDVFITGSTGFIGKMLVERLLTTCPEIGRLHLLMRTKKDVCPNERLQRLKEARVFDVLRSKNPDQLLKLNSIPGDIELPNLGLDDTSIEQLQKVSVIFHSAATVKFTERLPVATRRNVLAVHSLLDIADCLPLMVSFVHVSTAFSNSEHPVVEERVYPLPRPLPLMIEEALQYKGDDAETSKFIVPKRNSYTYTKAMAEVKVSERAHGKYPLAIFRPTIVISSHRDPFPGWVEGHNGPSGVSAAALQGCLHVLECSGEARADLLPVDIAVDTLIAVAWDIAVDNPSDVRVYNCSTSENPTTWEAMRQTIVKTGIEAPSAKAVYPPDLKFINIRAAYKFIKFLKQTVPLYFAEGVLRLFGFNEKRMNLIVVNDRISEMNDMLHYFMTNSFSFLAPNIKRLRMRLSPADAALFNLDPKAIEWEKTLPDHVMGCRRYVLNEKDDSIPEARKRMQRFRLLPPIFILSIFFIMIKVISCWKYYAIYCKSNNKK